MKLEIGNTLTAKSRIYNGNNDILFEAGKSYEILDIYFNRIDMDNEVSFKTDLQIDTNNNSMCVWTYFFKPSEARKLKLKSICK